MDRFEAIFERHSVRSYDFTELSPGILEDIKNSALNADTLGLSGGLELNYLNNTDKIAQKHLFKGIIGQYGCVTAPYYLHCRASQSAYADIYTGICLESAVLDCTRFGIGTCWIGCTAPKNAEEPGLFPYVITICFGRPDNAPRRLNAEEAKRKLLHEIVMGKISNPSLLPLLEAGRLAPSAMNMQPVRYITESTNIFIYRKRPLICTTNIEEMQCIDVGIAMANIYIASDCKRVFVREKNYPTPQNGCVYEYTALDAEALLAEDEEE